jgi:hypothetical protein
VSPASRPRRRAGAVRSLLGAGAVALVALATVGCSGDEGADDPSATSTTSAEDWVARTDDDAVFTVDCTFSHRAPDDPIVHPGHPGASHSHEFFGSEATDASSTGESLLDTSTTCEDPDDTAAYWVPTLSVAGTPVDPTFIRAYYRARPGVDVRDVEPPPLGLAMLSGDPDAEPHDHGEAEGSDGGHDHAAPTTEASHDHGSTGEHDEADHEDGDADHEDHDLVGMGGGWGCGLRPLRLRPEPPTDCTPRSPLSLQLRFPDCWDGEQLDSADHRSHLARSEEGACPSSHPVLITEVQVTVTWPVTGSEGADVSIASGDIAGAHGDFLNGWDPEAIAQHVDLCIHAKANCTVG